MYNLKKYLTATLVILMALGTTPLIAAPTASDSTEILNYSSEYYIIEYLSDIDFGRDIEFFSLEQNSRNRMRSNSLGVELQNKELLEFDTIEEFEEFLFLFIEEPFNFYSNNFSEISPFGGNNGTVNWWAPVSSWNGPTVATWRNIDFTYTRASRFDFRSNVRVTGSRLTGFQPGVHWSHLSGSVGNMQSDGSFNLTANGTWTMGVQITGNPVGVTWNDSWTRNSPN